MRLHKTKTSSTDCRSVLPCDLTSVDIKPPLGHPANATLCILRLVAVQIVDVRWLLGHLKIPYYSVTLATTHTYAI